MTSAARPAGPSQFLPSPLGTQGSTSQAIRTVRLAPVTTALSGALWTGLSGCERGPHRPAAPPPSPTVTRSGPTLPRPCLGCPRFMGPVMGSAARSGRVSPVMPCNARMSCHVMLCRDRRPAWLPRSELHPSPGSGHRPASGTDILQPTRHVNAHCSAAAALRLIRLPAGRPRSHWHLGIIIAQARLAGYTRWLRAIYLFWLISTDRDACGRGLSPPHTRADCSETDRSRRCLPQVR